MTIARTEAGKAQPEQHLAFHARCERWEACPVCGCPHEHVGRSEGEERSPAATDCPQRAVGKVGVSRATSTSPLGGALKQIFTIQTVV